MVVSKLAFEIKLRWGLGGLGTNQVANLKKEAARHMSLGRNKLALSILDEALALAPNDSELHQLCASVFVAKSDAPKAIRSATRTFPTPKATAGFRLTQKRGFLNARLPVRIQPPLGGVCARKMWL